MAYYAPHLKKVEGHVPRVPHQIAPMLWSTTWGPRCKTLTSRGSTRPL